MSTEQRMTEYNSMSRAEATRYHAICAAIAERNYEAYRKLDSLDLMNLAVSDIALDVSFDTRMTRIQSAYPIAPFWSRKES